MKDMNNHILAQTIAKLLYYRQLDSIPSIMHQQNHSQIQNRVNSIVCYLCGREFGTKGFAFHHKECRKRLNNQQKFRKQKTKIPDAPQGLQQVLQGNLQKIDLKNFNQLSNEIHKYKILSSCKYCNRTFNYQSLLIHMKGCDKQKTFKEQKENVTEVTVKTPKCLVCCVCGQRFGTLSLKIHYPECTKKFIDNEYRKHKKESDRRQPPQFSIQDEIMIKTKIQWQDDQMEAFNSRNTELYRAKAMAECSNCKRKFFDQQLAKHEKNCVLINGVISKAEKIEKKEAQAKKPRTIMCVICGREYGHASIAIHTQNCIDLFNKQQKLKAKIQKRPLPQVPPQERQTYNLKQAEEWPLEKIQSYNKIVANIYNTKSLAKCYICQRTFFQESLPKHMKDCETKIKDVRKLQKFKKQIKQKDGFFGENFIEDVIQMNKKLNKLPQKSNNKPKVLMCYLCGRDYGLASLKIHVPQCKLKTVNAKKMQQTYFQTVCQKIEEKYKIEESEQWSAAQIQEYNQETYAIYKKQSLFQCKFCSRTFFQESLSKHIKHCQNDTKSKLKRAQTMKDFRIQQKEQQSQQMKNYLFLNDLPQSQRQVSLKFIKEDEEQHQKDPPPPIYQNHQEQLQTQHPIQPE